MVRQFAFILCVLVLLTLAPVAAQAQQSSCPTPILVDIARAGSTCFGLEPGQACVGNGSVTALGFDGGALMTQAGDRADVRNIQIVSSTSFEDELSIVTLSLEEGMSWIAFGDVTLNNLVMPIHELTAVATGSANIRVMPEGDAEIIARAGVNDGLRLNGRTQDSRWVRAAVPGGTAFGWVSVDVLNIQGNLQSLLVTAPDRPVLRPFMQIEVVTGERSACENSLPSGALLQSANNEQLVTIRMGSAEVQLRGTAFVISRGVGYPTVYMYYGYAIVDGGFGERFIPAGAVDLGNAIIPFSASLMASLPLQLLPIPIALPDPITEADIARLIDAFYAARAETQATPAPQPTADPTICSRATRREVTLYAGPGDFYEAINTMLAGVTVDPVLATLDPDGRMWWQLRNSNWLLAYDVGEVGICPDVPVTQTISAPRSNTLSLETCETTNGPLRAGQQVRIEFTPPAFDNRGEGRDAPIIDPGRISIGARTYRAQVTEMVQLGTVGIDDRYLRTFYIHWTAIPGTHRIVGDRLSYEPICTLVVPVTN